VIHFDPVLFVAALTFGVFFTILARKLYREPGR
jgi:hypothetical protein